MERQTLMLPIAVALLACSVVTVHAAPSMRVPRSSESLRRQTACTASAAKALVRAFVRDYSTGRVAAADRLWAPTPRFQWFSSGPPDARLGSGAYDRATLAAYFRARARVHETIRLTELRAGYDPNRQIVNFNGKLVRSADRLPPTRPRDFKGAVDCSDGGISLIVWSM